MGRLASSVFALALLACTGSNTSDDDTPPEEAAFKIVSADVTLAPGDEVTKCFYFHTPNTENLRIHKWVSDLSPGSHHMIFFSSIAGTQPADGTVDDCEATGTPLPMYGTQIEHEELDFPLDDVGVQLAQVVTPATPGYFQMHYLNSTDQPLTAHVELSAFAMAEGVGFTRTDLFGTYNADISIPPHATNLTVSATCDVVDAKFWQLSSHSHKQSVGTTIKDGGTTIYTSADWEHPAQMRFDAPSFYQFTGKLTWECTYSNTGDNASSTIVDGQSARTNEMCMATGYYFPAAGPRGCVMIGGQCMCVL